MGDGVNDPNEPGASIATHIRHVVDGDPSLEALASMPPGSQAWRIEPGERWEVGPPEWGEG